MGSRKLNCLIEGESTIFVVSVGRDDVGVGPHTLELWKLKDSNPIDSRPGNTLVERIQSLGDGLSTFADKLEPTNRLFSIFSAKPPPDDVHIIVKLPATAIQQKRTLPEQDDMFNRLKRAKTTTDAPSKTAKSEAYESLQRDPSQKIFDDRPEPDPHFPPVALLYEGFGHFLDIMDGRRDVPGLTDIDIMELHKEVDGFASQMNRFYQNEDARREAGLPYLARIFSARRGTQIPPLQASSIGSARTDGHTTGPLGAGTFCAVFKNKITGIGAIPQVELTCYVVRLNAMRMDDDRELYLRWRVPCLGLTIIGCKLEFYAIVAIDHRFRLVSLTPTLSCIQSASDGRDRASLYLAFTAASVLQASILQDIEK
ncbi:hypothetical protein F5887DRAFT_1287113 [Amanita rubescens]|nr:hypothetical protein F5887DRAFT_1287113 [Amanita rubescens]